MRLLPTKMCKPGMKLAKKIYTEDGLVLLGQGVELTERLIGRLIQCCVWFVYVEDPRTADIEIPEMIRDETRIRAVAEIRSAFREMVNAPKRKGVTYPNVGKQLRGVMNMILDELGNRHEAMIMLMNMGTVDHYLYQHSLNVCIYSTILGMAEGYSNDELMVLGLGALTEQEFAEIKRHTEYGFQILKDEPNIPLIAAHCAFQHHERLDGSGYPRGIKGNEIHEYAKWIGIADSYDAMTSTRSYRDPMLPHMAIEQLYIGTGTLYEQRMVQVFRDKVVLYPIGLTVKLSTGELGVVVDINGAYAHRPVVRILNDADGWPLVEPYEVDLSKQLTTMIIGIAQDESGISALAGH
ncbi:histidine kinase [Paenibacillus darwinianus]|uniref:HD-GYP domain-containing protein n=1 Tax=Paenibacillus darwinianus TaxID=1380763 RepID=UPI0004456B44|nr:HD domain-containing phosphohydrolase [Paenibacillus darwinianus]EXX92441.1 histidine kinase [Paenibacillus darwinianus]